MKKQQKYAIMVSTLVVLMMTGASGPARASLITNGSFESSTPGNPSPGSYLWDFQTTPDYWSYPNGQPGASVALFRQPYGGNAEDGFQWEQLQGPSGPGTIEQTFNTTLGVNYAVSFWYAAISRGNSGMYELTLGITGDTSVLIGGSDLAGVGANTTGVGGGNLTTWNEYTFFYIGTGSPATLSFTGQSEGDGNFSGPALDNVSVDEIIPVPEPATFVLLLIGGGLMAFRRRFGS